jgi:hypothetical protein
MLAVEPCHCKRVTGLKRRDRPAQLGAAVLPARRLGKHAAASGLTQLSHLRVKSSSAHGDPRVAIFHGAIMHRTRAPKKRNIAVP